MPYFFFWCSTLIGAYLGLSEQVVAFVVVLALTFVLYVTSNAKRKIVAKWLLLSIFGLVLGRISAEIALQKHVYPSDLCQGVIVKVYDKGVAIKLLHCGAENPRKALIYAACSFSWCDEPYSSVEVEIKSNSAFGRFVGKGQVRKRLWDDVEMNHLEKAHFRLLSAGYVFRKSFYTDLVRKIPERQASLVTSMLLGETQLPTELSQEMKDLGVVHIIAISGINIVYLRNLLELLLKRVGRKIQQVSELAILISLFVIVGAAVSLTRAIGTVVAQRTTEKIGFLVDTWLIFLVLAAIVLFDARYIFDAGYWLVSSACIGVYGVGRVIEKLFKCQNLLTEVLFSMGIWACVAPAQLVFFGRVQVLGIVVGLFLAPLVELVSLLGYCQVVFNFFSSICRFLGTSTLGVVCMPFLYILEVIKDFSASILGILCSQILLVIDVFHGFTSQHVRLISCLNLFHNLLPMGWVDVCGQPERWSIVTFQRWHSLVHFCPVIIRQYVSTISFC